MTQRRRQLSCKSPAIARGGLLAEQRGFDARPVEQDALGAGQTHEGDFAGLTPVEQRAT